MTLAAVVLLLVAPSPKFQNQLVALPEEESVKVTVSGTSPLVDVAEKFATGGGMARTML